MEIKVEIVSSPIYRAYEVWVYREAPDGSVQRVKPVAVEWEAVGEGVEIYEPTVRIPHRDADTLFKAFVDALRGHGVIAEPEHQLVGKMKAMEYHLEDFRKLVFERRVKP